MVLKCTPNIENYRAYYNHNSTCCVVFSQNPLNACLQLLTTKQMISLRLEHQKKNEENDQLKDYEPGTVTCECHRD